MFQLRQPVLWDREQMVIVGKTYTDPRVYVLQDSDGATYVDVAEEQLEAIPPVRLVEHPRYLQQREQNAAEGRDETSGQRDD